MFQNVVSMIQLSNLDAKIAADNLLIYYTNIVICEINFGLRDIIPWRIKNRNFIGIIMTGSVTPR